MHMLGVGMKVQGSYHKKTRSLICVWCLHLPAHQAHLTTLTHWSTVRLPSFAPASPQK